MVDDIDVTPTPAGPLGSPGGQLLQRGMNFLFGKPPQKGMVAPAPVAKVVPAAPLNPNDLGTGMLGQDANAIKSRPQQIDTAVRDAGG